MSMCSTSLRDAAILACLLPVAGAAAIVVRHDLPAAASLVYAREAQFAGVAALVTSDGQRGTGTLVGDRWILTAAHVADDAPGNDWIVVFGSRFHDVAEVVIHPDWTGDLDDGHDVALMRLVEPIAHIAAVDLFRGEDEPGMPVSVAGYGWTGTGREGIRTADDRRRAATNVIADHVDDCMILRFDDPESGRATEREGIAAYSDSGGPVLVHTKGGWKLAGVHSFVMDLNANGVLADYGDAEGATRVAPYLDWIDEVLGGCPPDVSGDGTVGLEDLMAVLAAAGGPAGGADVDGSGVVDFDDVRSVLGAWGPCRGAAE